MVFNFEAGQVLRNSHQFSFKQNVVKWLASDFHFGLTLVQQGSCEWLIQKLLRVMRILQLNLINF